MSVANRFLLIGLILMIFSSANCMGLFDFFRPRPQSGGRYITEQQFKDNSAKQMQYTPQTLMQLRKIGVNAGNELKLEYFFYTNSLEKAKAFSKEIAKLGYTTKYGESQGVKNEFVVTGWTSKMKMDDKTVLSWTQMMCNLGYKFDCDFDGWGTSPDSGLNKVTAK